MSRCIQLAKNGLGSTYPNPLVGSVIVKDDTIIGEGWHYKSGQAHAEVNAINSVIDSTLLKDATLYVNLEPCSHFGKTPPCSDLIIEKGIKKVVIGCTDPNPKVAGKGITKLMNAGCDVTVGVLEEECEELNKRFITFQTKKRPYIFLKWAESSDGFIAPSTKNEQKPVWISNIFSRQLAHKLRAEEQAILVGSNTVIEDNPSLSTRDWEGNNPIRVIVDGSLKVNEDADVFNKNSKTYIINKVKSIEENDNYFIMLNFNSSISLVAEICDFLFKKNIQSLIVEGGSTTLQSFITTNLWDEALIFKGGAIFSKGIKAPILKRELFKKQKIKNDILLQYKNQTS